jgi:hypothetical protein
VAAPVTAPVTTLALDPALVDDVQPLLDVPSC